MGFKGSILYRYVFYGSIIFHYPIYLVHIHLMHLSTGLRLNSDNSNSLADLNVCWALMFSGTFSDVAAQIDLTDSGTVNFIL